MVDRQNVISQNATAYGKVNGHGMLNVNAFVIDFESDRRIIEDHSIEEY